MSFNTALTASPHQISTPKGEVPAPVTPGGAAPSSHLGWKFPACPKVANRGQVLSRARGLTDAEANFIGLGVPGAAKSAGPSFAARPQSSTAAPDPRPDDPGAGWLKHVLSRLHPSVWVGAEPVPAKNACPVDDPQCDKTNNVQASGTALPRPYSILTNFLEDVNKDVFTVSMPNHLQDRQARMRLDQVHVLVVIRVAGKGRIEAERLLRQHFKWTQSQRPDLRVSCAALFAREIPDLEPGELWPEQGASQLKELTVKFRTAARDVERYGRSRNLLRPGEDLGDMSGWKILNDVLGSWANQYRSNPDMSEEIKAMSRELAQAMTDLELTSQILLANAADEILQNLQSMSRDRPKISILSEDDYRKVKDRMQGMGRMVRLEEKAP